jgi:two-component system OmpR family response regulator
MLGGWTIDLAARCARSSARVVDLTPGETAILRVLLERPGRVCSRAELLASTRRGDTELFERTVDVLIARLRRKLELDGRTPPLIHTVGEEGYRLTPGVTSSAR